LLSYQVQVSASVEDFGGGFRLRNDTMQASGLMGLTAAIDPSQRLRMSLV
jgi:hypothetical protein